MSNSLSQWFGWNRTVETSELPEIFPLPITLAHFVQTDIVSIYSKILTDVVERTHGLSDELVALLWDNCVKSNASDGLITLLAKAMADKRELFLVYEKGVQVVRVATGEEQTQIKADYDKQARSTVGIYVSFKNFTRSDMVKFYIGLEYLTVGSLYKQMNLAKALQLKMNDLRASTGLNDSADVTAQAKTIAQALGGGKDVLLDAKDIIETNKPDLTAVQAGVDFVTQKLSFYLGLPGSYLSGEQTGGIGSSGENDMRAVERGLTSYYFAIIKPVLESLFTIKTSYKSQDTRQILGSMEVLKTFGLVDETLISADNKRMIVNRLLGLPEDAKGDPAPRAAAAPVVAAVAPPRTPANA